MDNLNKIEKNITVVQDLISNSKYNLAYKTIDKFLKKYPKTKKYSLKIAKQIFELYKLKYEAAVYIMPSAQAHRVLDELYAWSILSHDELWVRLELLEFKIRYNNLTDKEITGVLKNIEQLIAEAQEDNDLDLAVWAANKYFKMAPLADRKVNYKKYLFLIKVARARKLYEAEMWCIYHLGLIYLHDKRYAKAEENFRNSLNIAYQINQKEGIKWNLYNLGQLYLQSENDKDKASQYFSQAISIAQETETRNNYDDAILRSISEIQHHLFQFNRLAILGRRIASETHELKNLLCANQLAINNLESILRDCSRSSDYQDFLESIKKTNQEILNKTKSMLVYAKNSELQENGTEAICVADVLRNFKQMTLSMLKESYMTVDVNIAKNTAKTTRNFSEKDLVQALLNLTLNSVDALRGENGKIIINLSLVNKKVLITFSDNGPGVDPVSRNKLFRPFFTTKTTGTGIGLFTTKELLKKNNISIELADMKTKGATFLLRFDK